MFFPEYGWTKEHVEYANFKKGDISCPFELRVFGVACIGEGKYKAKINGKHTKYYRLWRAMIQRCYDFKYIEKYPTYEGCEVDSRWLNFQVFAEWVNKNYYEVGNQRMDLDKDILIKGNKIYSPDTCIFVPQNINKLFIKCDGSRGDLPVGVTYEKKKYRVRCHMNGKNQSLGYYKNSDEAFQVYKNFKEKYIKEVAEEYKNVIPQKLYNAMINYKVEIDD